MPTIPDGLHCQDNDLVLKKLKSFAADGPTKLHILADFDMTLTAGKRPGENLGTWDVMDALMPPEGVARHSEIYQSFRPIELAGKLTPAIAVEKWTESLDLIVSYHMSLGDIKAAFLSLAMLRPGVKELFDLSKAKGIPAVIISSGLRNVIEIVAGHYDIHPDYILSNNLIVDDNGRVRGWQKDSLIHLFNKHEVGHEELSRLRTTRPNIILLGDVPADADMVSGHENVIKVRVLDSRRGEDYHQAEALQFSFEAGYDLVTDHSLKPVVRILSQL